MHSVAFPPCGNTTALFHVPSLLSQFQPMTVAVCRMMLRAIFVVFALSVFLGTQSGQAQTACEPKNSFRCRYVALCLDRASKSKFKSAPPLEEDCACTWDQLARAFSVEEHALLFEYLQASPESIADQRALFPNEAAHEAFARRVFKEAWKMRCSPTRSN